MKILINVAIMVVLYGCSSANSDFELCDGNLYPYYYPELKYKGEFYAIKRSFYDQYKIIESANNSGIVRIQFHVNCKGVSGNFEVETYDLTYRKNTIDNQIVAQLLQLSKELNGWVPGVNEDGETINSHKFLAFRIVNGELIDILPK